jgi:hypothetical protein
MIPNRSAVCLCRIAWVVTVVISCNVWLSLPSLAQTTDKADRSEPRIAAAMAHYRRFQSSNSLDELRATAQGLYLAADLSTIKPSDVVARRRSIVSGFAQVLHQIELQKDPSFDATDPNSQPAGCVIPPEEPSGRGLQPCADPNAITDPATRAKYVAAINANNLKLQRFSRNLSLYNLENEAMADIEMTLLVFHAKAPSDGPAIDNILRKAGLSDTRRLKINAMI